MIQVKSYTIPTNNKILIARQERGKLTAASFNLHQAIQYYEGWKNHTGQPECIEYASKLLIKQCNSFAELTYNNPYANSFGEDIKLAFYYFNLLENKINN